MTTKDYFSNPPQPNEQDLTWANTLLNSISQRYGDLVVKGWDFRADKFNYCEFHQPRNDFYIYAHATFLEVCTGYLGEQGINYILRAGEPVPATHLLRVIDLMLEDRDIREQAQS